MVLELWSDTRTDRLGFVPKLPDSYVDAGMPDLLNASLQRYGAELGLPRITRFLDERGITATGVMSGKAVEDFPEVVRAFAHGAVEREICAHSWTQDLQMFALDDDAARDNITRCTEVISAVIGRRPVGWVSPSGRHRPSTPGLLASQGYLYLGDYADTDAAEVWEVDGQPMVRMSVPWEVNDASQFARNYHPPSAYVELFKRSFDVLYQEGGGVLGAVAHAMTFGRPFGVHALEEVYGYATSHPDVWIASREEIARHVLSMAQDDPTHLDQD